MATQGYLVLRSEDRDKTTDESPSNIYFTEKQNYFSNSGVNSLEGESFQMFYDVPNINERNNVLVVDDGGTSYPVIVPEGGYTYISLAGRLAIELNALGLGLWAVVWNLINQRFEITAPVPVKFTKYPLQKRDMGAIVGLEYETPLQLNFFGGSADLSYTRDIYIVCDSLHRHKREDDQFTNPRFNNVLMVVPVYGNEEIVRANGADGTQKGTFLNPRSIYYQPSWPKKINFNPMEAISNIRIQLFDDQGELLYNPYGKESYRYRMTLSFTKSR